jgi:hypothetical protein
VKRALALGLALLAPAARAKELKLATFNTDTITHAWTGGDFTGALTESVLVEALEPVCDGLRRVLPMADVQDVVSNAKAQLKAPTTRQLVEALRYCAQKEAFISFAPSKP